MSPVVGVVLMIVLAVSLTVVVGGFTSDLVDQAAVDSAPQATLNTYNEGDGDGVRVAHDGGDDLEFDEVNVVVRRANGGEIDAGNLTISENASTFAPGDTFLITSSEFDAGSAYRIIVFDESSGNIIDDGVVEYES